MHALHVRELPLGWLGKLNALEQGTRQATGEWLLFTEAGVHIEPDALEWEIADDVGVGWLLKASGARCAVVLATEHVSLRFYSSLRDTQR